MPSILAAVASANLLTALLTVLTVAISGLLFYRYFLHPLAKFPGPLEAALSYSWYNTRIWRGNWHEDVLALHEKFGPAVRISPGQLHLQDASALRVIYNTGTKATKTTWYDSWQSDDGSPAAFSTRDRKLHAFLRKRINPAFTMTAVQDTYEGYMQEVLDLFLSKMKAFAEAGKPVDLFRWTDHFGYDAIATLAYGEPLGFLETDSDVMGIENTIKTSFFLVNGLANYWRGAWWIRNKYSQRLMEACGIPNPTIAFEAWTYERGLKRKMQHEAGEGEMRPDILSHLVRMKGDDGKATTMKEILTEMLAVVGAGADTTSISIRMFIWHICTYPKVYRRVRDEIDAYYKDHALQEPITYKQTLELPFFCATVREAQRVWPAIPAPLPRTTAEALVVGGRNIPAGTTVSMSAVAANRDPQVFGEDADSFNPSRWLGDDEKVRWYNTHDLSFGGTGPTRCLGKNIADVEVHKFLAQFLRNFDVELVEPGKPMKIKVAFFAISSDLNVKLKYRGGGLKGA